MTYRDEGDHVLLSDATTRVRIWSNSNKVSVGGNARMMRGQTTRQGSTLMVPAPMADHVLTQVFASRDQHLQIARVAPPPGPRPQPVRRAAPRPTPHEPAPAKPALVPVLGGDPSWEVPSHAPAREWRWIILHHSDDLSGNLAKYDRIHRQDNGWDECGYHFVIGNGTESGDGEVEVGSRWFKQKHGAHCKTEDNRYNDHGIGITLVGDFESHGRPTAAQMESLVRLCRFLMQRHGIPLAAIQGHCDCCATACPGKNFPWSELRSRLSR
jgi:hypothetical protein